MNNKYSNFTQIMNDTLRDFFTALNPTNIGCNRMSIRLANSNNKEEEDNMDDDDYPLGI